MKCFIFQFTVCIEIARLLFTDSILSNNVCLCQYDDSFRVWISFPRFLYLFDDYPLGYRTKSAQIQSSTSHCDTRNSDRKKSHRYQNGIAYNYPIPLWCQNVEYFSFSLTFHARLISDSSTLVMFLVTSLSFVVFLMPWLRNAWQLDF